MDTVLPNAQSSAAFTGINSGWDPSPNNYTATYGSLDFGDADLSMPLGGENSSLSIADAMSTFTYQEPAYQTPYPIANTIDPMSIWPPGPNRASGTLSATSRHDSAYSSAGTPKSTGSAGLEGSGMLPHPSPRMPTTTATEDFGMAAHSSPGILTTTETESFGTMAYPSSVSPTTAQPENPKLQPEAPEPIIQPESDSTCRARYAANQRHQKARNTRQAARETTSSSDTNTSSTSTSTKAEEKKRNLRDKNKVAAAKCRQRQRKQAESIRAKSARLSETNAQLKSYVQELRGELNGLRSLALGHGECDERLARYNQVQAERVMRECYSACGLAGSMVNSREQKAEAPQSRWLAAC